MCVPSPTIYFAQVHRPDGPVKIGYTGRRVAERMAEGQTFCPVEIEVLAETYGTFEDEAKLHRIFQPFHLRGEWYTMSPPLRELIDHLLFDGGNLQVWLDTHD